MIKLIGVYESATKNKKLVALFNVNDKLKKVNFGSKNSKTYLDHKDPIKRENYIARHTALGNEDYNDPLSPASLSMFLLWGNHTDLQMNIKDYINRFKL
jgi:hypothetical protein